MTLHDYLKLHDLPMTDFAEKVGTTGATICRIINGRVVPRRALMVDIHRVTGGAVCPNDLMQLFPPECRKTEESLNGHQ